MASTPLFVIEGALASNFGQIAAEVSLPPEEFRIEDERRYTKRAQALNEVMSGRERLWDVILAESDHPVGFAAGFLSYLSAFRSVSAGVALAWAAREVIPSPVDMRSISSELQPRFRELVAQWHQETDFLSSPTDIALNFNYQQVIGMGPAVLPLIMGEMRGRGGRWFWALRAITGVDPVPDGAQGNTAKMKEAWLRWWEQNA